MSGTISGLILKSHEGHDSIRTCKVISKKIVTNYFFEGCMSRGPNLRADERRAVTIEAVIDLASSQNPAEITTEAIARHMKLSQGAIFRHFASKEAIWQGVMGWIAERLLSRVDAAARGESSPTRALTAMFNANIAFVREHPGVPRLLFGELQKSGDSIPKRMVRTILSSYSDRIVELLDEGKLSGEFRPDLNTQAAALLYVGTIQGLVMRTMSEVDPASIFEQSPEVFAVYLRGIECKS